LEEERVALEEERVVLKEEREKNFFIDFFQKILILIILQNKSVQPLQFLSKP